MGNIYGKKCKVDFDSKISALRIKQSYHLWLIHRRNMEMNT